MPGSRSEPAGREDAERKTSAREPAERHGWVGYVALVAAGLAPLLAVGLRSVTAPDFWMRLATGRHIASEGIPRLDVFVTHAEPVRWVNPTWLYDLLLFWLWERGGSAAVVSIHALFMVAAFTLLAARTWRWCRPAATAIGLAASAWMLLPVYRVGPSVTGFLFAAVFLYVLREGPDPRRHLPWLLPLQAAWANLGSGFLLGPLIAGFSAAEQLSGRSRTRRARPGFDSFGTRSPVLFVGLLLLASVIHPFTGSVVRSAISDLLSARPSGSDLGMLPPMLPWFRRAVFHYAFLASLAICAVGVVTRKGRLPLLPVALAFGAAFFAFRTPETIGWFAVLGFPFLAISVDAAASAITEVIRIPGGGARMRIAGAAAAGAATVATAFFIASGWADRATGHFSRPGLSTDETLFPSAAHAYLAHLSGSIFNLPFDGGYLSWSHPGRTVFADTRPQTSDTGRLDLLRRLLAGEPSSMAEMDRLHAPDILVVSCLWPGGAAFVRMRLEEAAWELGYADGVTAVLLRRATVDSDALDPALGRQGLALVEGEIRHAQGVAASGRRPRFSPRLAGAALLFAALERDRETLEILDLLERAAPRMVQVHMLRGVALVRLERYEEGLRSLEHFIRSRPESRQAWYWISRAHEALGNETEAKRAAERNR